MVLLRGETWQPVNLENIRAEEELFVVKSTGQAIREYEDYLANVQLLREPVWGCQYTERDGLTYEQAATSEATSRDLLKQVSVTAISVHRLELVGLCTPPDSDTMSAVSAGAGGSSATDCTPLHPGTTRSC